MYIKVNVIQILFGQILMIMLPFIFGKIALRLLRLRNLEKENIFSWLVGFIILTLIFILIMLTYNSFIIRNAFLIIILINIFFYLPELVQNMINVNHLDQIVLFKFKPNLFKCIYSIDFVILVIIIILGILPVSIASIHVPFPHFGLTHSLPKAILQPIYRIAEDGVPQFDIRYGEVLLAYLSSVSVGIEPMHALWFSRFTLSLVLAFSTYYLSLSLLNNKRTAIFAPLITVFANSGFYYHPYYMLFFCVPAQHFGSDVIVFVLLPLLILLILREGKKTPSFVFRFKIFITSFIISLSFTLFAFLPYEIIFLTNQYYKHIFIDPYFYIISIPSLFLFFYYKYISSSIQTAKLYYEILIKLYIIFISLHFFHREEAFLFYFILLLIFLFSNVTNLSIYLIFHLPRMYNEFKTIRKNINNIKVNKVLELILISSMITNLLLPKPLSLYLLTKSTWDVDFKFKLNEFLYGNGIFVLAFTLFAFFYVTLYSWFNVSWYKDITSFLIVLGFSIYFLPISWTYRNFKFLSIIMGIAISLLINDFLKLMSRAKLRVIFAVFIFLCLLIDGCITINRRFSYRYPGMNYQIALYPYEIEAAYWIRNNLPKNTLLISDYFSMWVLTPLSNKIWAIDEYMLFHDMPQHLRENIYVIKDFIFRANSSYIAYKNIIYLKEKIPIQEKIYLKYLGKNDTDVIIVITSRTISWIRASTYDPFIYCPPGSIDVDFPELKIFKSSEYFDLIYRNDNVIIFALRK